MKEFCLLLLTLFFLDIAAKKLPSIAVFGGSGKLGSECVFQGLKMGERMCTLTRSPLRKVTVPPGSGGKDAGSDISDPNLKVYQGSVTNQKDVNKVFEENDVKSVIIALGGRTKDVGKSLLCDGTRCIIKAMKDHNVKRVAVVTSIGTGDSIQQAPLMFKILMKTVMKKTMLDKNNQEKLFLDESSLGSDLDYCIIRPGQLGIGPPTGIVDVIDGKAGRMSRADLASFCLKAISEEDFPYLRRAIGVCSVDGTSWKKVKQEGYDAVTSA